MIIDIQHDNILIYDSGNLRPVHKSQLSFWQFIFGGEPDHYVKPIEDELFLKLIKYFKKEQIEFVLTKAAQEYTDELKSRNLNFQRLKDNISNFKNGQYSHLEFDKFREFTAANLNRSLRIHQLKAAYHLYSIGNGANFSVPGSGKTSVVLAVYEKLRLEGKVNTLFVVGPPASFGPWKAEFFQTLGRKPKHTILAGGNRQSRKSQYFKTSQHKSELYLTTFQSLLYDQEEVRYFLNQNGVDTFLVVDEAHYIKKINGNWASAILNQSNKVTYRCVLTGTPMPKSYADIYNLFDFLWPEQHVISSENKTRIRHYELNGNRKEAKRLLNDIIGPLFYRVRKSDLKLSEPNFMTPELIEMNKYERLIYDAIYRRIKDFSKNEYFKNIDFISRLGRGRIMRLRQSVSYTSLLNTAIEDYKERLFEDVLDLKRIVLDYDTLEVPAKITHLIEKVYELQLNKQKVVIWSNFIGTINLIEGHLQKLNLRCKKIYGDTPVEGASIKSEETREKIRDEFVNPDSGIDILIANPAACAESISLHKTCHHSIYYDLSYNCAQYLQSLDRIHRVGGSELTVANYHYLQYRNTIDSDIKENLDNKRQKMYEVVEEEYPIYSLDMFEEDSDSEAYNRLFNK
ncbi:MAG: DEAD/DEAH box helicase [Bacteroidota bacterium]